MVRVIHLYTSPPRFFLRTITMIFLVVLVYAAAPLLPLCGKGRGVCRRTHVRLRCKSARRC